MYLELFPELDRGRGGHAVHAVFQYLVFMYGTWNCFLSWTEGVVGTLFTLFFNI
jgi:hypothetical protein